MSNSEKDLTTEEVNARWAEKGILPDQEYLDRLDKRLAKGSAIISIPVSTTPGRKAPRAE